jgi:hypothetical protein
VKPQTQAQSVSDFLAWVPQVRRLFEFGDDDPFGPWFRGQQREYWALSPTLFREYGGQARIREDNIEDELREEFIVRAPIFSESTEAVRDDWEWYFLMQHYGAPTRLLDWTEGALLALYFAVRDNPGFYDAAVWALDPYALNDRAINKPEVIPPSASGLHEADRRRVRPWLPERFRKGPVLPDKPLAVVPTHTARRISTQRSCFTVHGKDAHGLDRLVAKRIEPLVVKIIIPSFRVISVRRELESAGIDETTIFPDLEGLSRSLRAKWRSARRDLPHARVYTRLRPSPIHGVGVFAIRDIPKGTFLFSGDNEEMLWIEEHDLPRAPKEMRRLYDDFAVVKDNRYGCPTNFNRLTMSWYLNEPRKDERPNVKCDATTYDFFALEDIKTGDELTVDYSAYSEQPLPLRGDTKR